ncbi:cupredoxin domain-containing protein [Jiella sp. MQZ9-1]|uniref:Cupredoxin domain-containing protein n=1 Tax=Jiella flava TaxID=2816857 RepID=A0A939JRJ2_9HYPH|nr:plastocyanin/azurin family copper-binding protein [Jiella flava]MBO0661968.1 cupredoxin domain-containing protein [Jiella flava]MCD2470705.1 cupredoxin domain-containing protein [Jiella flava]
MSRALIATLATTLAIVPAASVAAAAESHSGDHHAESIEIAPSSAKPDRTITINMVERPDGSMGFTPDHVTVTAGRTIRFEVHNTGTLDHEFVVGDHEALMEHKAEMEKMPDMKHTDPGELRLAPGQSGSVTLRFDKPGPFGFACLIPGHYEVGMHGVLTVTAASQS